MTEQITMVVGPSECYYDRPLSDRTIIKVNLLQNVVKYINNESGLDLQREDFEGLESALYSFLGGAKSDAELQAAVELLCSRVPDFIYYMVYCDNFSDKSLKGWLRYIYPIRKQLVQDLAKVRALLNSIQRSKFCAWVNDTLYYSVPLGTRVGLDLETEYVE